MKLVKLVRTCWACPSQWDGILDDGRWLYIRYRGGRFSVSVGEHEWDAVTGERLIEEYFGDPLAGYMTDAELIERLMKHGWEVTLPSGWKSENADEFESE